jgi:hypothetical protein
VSSLDDCAFQGTGGSSSKSSEGPEDRDLSSETTRSPFIAPSVPIDSVLVEEEEKRLQRIDELLAELTARLLLHYASH